MPAPAPRESPPSLGNRAAADLRFIRDTMARSASFSAVPGRGGVVMGAVGLAAAIAAARQPTPDRWLAIWLLAGALAFGVGMWAIVRKATHAGLSLDGPTPRHFFIGLSAPLVAGAAITYLLWSVRGYEAMPAVWLLLYGAGVLAGGAVSVPIVRTTGAVFMLLGFVAILTPPEYGNVWLGAGFGAVHVVSGIVIARRHGG